MLRCLQTSQKLVSEVHSLGRKITKNNNKKKRAFWHGFFFICFKTKSHKTYILNSKSSQCSVYSTESVKVTREGMDGSLSCCRDQKFKTIVVSLVFYVACLRIPPFCITSAFFFWVHSNIPSIYLFKFKFFLV